MSQQALLDALVPAAPRVDPVHAMKLAAQPATGGGRVGRMTEAEKDAEWFDELQAALPLWYSDGWL